MTHRFWSGLPGRVLLLIFILGMPGVGNVSAQESLDPQQELPIEIQVVPPSSAPLPVQTTLESGDGERATPTTLPGTVSVVLVKGSVVDFPDSVWRSSFYLRVTDDRGYAGGWEVVLGSETTSPSGSLMLDRYRHRTEVLAGQLSMGIDGPRGNRLYVGQPLAAAPVVMVAKPGAGHGTYGLRFGLVAPPEYTPGPVTLFLTLHSAP